MREREKSCALDGDVKTYHNTNLESGDTLVSSCKKALTQQWAVYRLFERNPGWHYTPFEVQKTALPTTIITDVRRAMSNLTEEGLLLKTDIMRPGKYGKLNHTWKLKENGVRQLEFEGMRYECKN